MDQSELLTALVVRAAAFVLVVLLARLAVAFAIALLARAVHDRELGSALSVWAVRAAPRCARTTVGLVAGLGLVVGASGAATAAGVVPAVPDLDRAIIVATVAPAVPTSAPHVTPTATPTPRPHARPATAHVVRAGESLWSIAAAQLGPAASPRSVAAHWPRWYAANRALIGRDPGRIHPGQVLRAPTTVPGGDVR